MLANPALLIASFLTLSVFAAPTANGNSCKSGSAQCCDHLYSRESTEATQICANLGLDITILTAKIGARCSPLTVIGFGLGGSCSGTPACCDQTYSDGSASGCSPLMLNH
ncbi:hypothetical protein BD779DRAFT_1671227 [Infundibulicybe gibba]|nr:hypothetical protein BD779DRAFT_1671227 [Infundibulicybe gibba]